ncbi:hypothetical protein GF312_08820 [Candidatus Poribacteria bacterium]|nr:hypothetical protein [Candidatus Poribacteria bacterium]
MASIGEQLKAARMAKEKSLDEVSNDTKISKKYLEALEADDYNVFPAPIYAKGSLKAYANYVALDYEALDREYKKLTGLSKLASGDSNDSVENKAETKSSNNSSKIIIPIATIVLIIVVAAIYYYFFYGK